MATTKEEHILDIQVSYDQALNGITKYRKELAELQKREEELAKAEKAGLITDEEKQKELDFTRVAIKQYKEDIRTLQKEVQNNIRQEKQQEGSLKQLRAQLSNATKAYDEMSRAERNSAKGKELQNHIKSISTELKNVEGDTERFYRNVGNYQNSIAAALTGNNKFASSILGMTQGGEGFKGMITGMVTSVKSFGSALMGLMTNPVFLGLAGIAGAGAAFKFFYDYNQGIAEATRLTKEFMGIEGDALTSVRNSIQATADTFGKDYKEVLTTVDALMAQYGISAEEAIKVVNDGFVAGADLSGDMLSKLQQYAPTFHDAGVDASELAAILAQTRSGIFSDKGMDTIQMASKRIREMSTSTASALDAIGISSEQVQKDLESGAKSTFDVIQEVSKQLKTLPPDSQKVGAVLKDVFGRQGADAGIQLIEQLDTMSTKIEEVKKTTGEYGEMQEEQLKATEELNNAMSTLFDMSGKGWETMMMQIKVLATRYLATAIKSIIVFINHVIDLYNDSVLLRGIIQAMGVAFKNLWSIVKTAFNLIIDGAKGVGRSLEGILYVLEGIFTFSLEKAQKGWEMMTGSMPKALKEGFGDIKKAGGEMAQNLADGFNNTLSKTPLKHLEMDGGVASGTGGATSLPLLTDNSTDNGGGGSGDKTKGNAKASGANAAKAVEERAKVERDAVAKAEEMLTKLITDNLERRRAEINASYDKQVEDVKAKLADKSKLTDKAEQALTSQLASIEELRRRELAKLGEQSVKQEIELANKRIGYRLDAVKKGSEEEMNLKLQQLANQQKLEEASIAASVDNETKREELLAAMRESYAAKRLQIEKDHADAVVAEQERIIGEEWQAKIQAAANNELEQARLREQQSLEALKEAKQREFETLEEFNKRRKQLELQWQQDKKELTNKEIEVEQSKYDAIASITSGLKAVGESFAESSKGMAKVSKVLALAEIAINTGSAVALGIKRAQEAGPWPANIAAYAMIVGQILSGMASAIKIVKGAKFARGGAVWGEGTATSDSIPARLSNGESVIAAAPTAMFAPLLSALNQLGGGAPIIVSSPQQQIGEDFLASAVAKGMALAPRPVVSVEDISKVESRVDVIESISTL